MGVYRHTVSGSQCFSHLGTFFWAYSTSRSLPATGQNPEILQALLAFLPVHGSRLLNDLPHMGLTIAARVGSNEFDNLSCTIRAMQKYRRLEYRL